MVNPTTHFNSDCSATTQASINRSAYINASAGAAAGAISKTVMAPVERVKLLLQLRGSIDKKSVHKRVGSYQVVNEIYKNQGLVSFWRGNTPNVIRQGGTSALNFMFMDSYKVFIGKFSSYVLENDASSTPESLKARKRRWRLWSSFLSGGLAGGTTTTALYPLEFFRTRLAMDMGNSSGKRKYPRGMIDVVKSTYHTDGVRGFYQGYGVALLGVVIYRALHLGGYDVVKYEMNYYYNREENIQQRNINDDSSIVSLGIGQRFFAAQLVSVIAGTVCYPIDSVRRRLMMQAGLPSFIKRKYRNGIDCCQKVLTEEGLKGFYLGIGPNLIRSFGGALLLIGYDGFKAWMQLQETDLRN